MGLRQKVINLIPPAYYEDGKESQCTIFKICNMFDCNSESFKEVKEKKVMENNKEPLIKHRVGNPIPLYTDEKPRERILHRIGNPIRIYPDTWD